MCENVCLVIPGRLQYTPADMVDLFESILLVSPYNPLATISAYHTGPLPSV